MDDVFKDNVDAWIKQIRREFAKFSDIPSRIQENEDNIQHNYELVYELKDQIEALKQEIVEKITISNTTSAGDLNVH